jgi:hypothetical protein
LYRPRKNPVTGWGSRWGRGAAGRLRKWLTPLTMTLFLGKLQGWRILAPAKLFEN